MADLIINFESTQTDGIEFKNINTHKKCCWDLHYDIIYCYIEIDMFFG